MEKRLYSFHYQYLSLEVVSFRDMDVFPSTNSCPLRFLSKSIYVDALLHFAFNDLRCAC